MSAPPWEDGDVLQNNRTGERGHYIGKWMRGRLAVIDKKGHMRRTERTGEWVMVILEDRAEEDTWHLDDVTWISPFSPLRVVK